MGVLKLRKFLIITDKKWHKNLCYGLNEIFKDEKIHFVEQKEFWLTDGYESYYNQFEKIFFVHYNSIIPKEFHEKYECITFHIGELPNDRGGSPIKHQILKGVENTYLNAIKVTEVLDGGPVYVSFDFSLSGSLEEILIRANNYIRTIIEDIILFGAKPKKQDTTTSETTKRRKPRDSNIETEDIYTQEYLFNFIRMLDAEGYPKAYLDINNFRFEFSRVSKKCDHLLADVKIYEK